MGGDISQKAAENVAHYLLVEADLAYLLSLADAVRANSDGTAAGDPIEDVSYQAAFESELRAHLELEAGLDRDEAEVVGPHIAGLLSDVARHQVGSTGRASLASGPAHPTPNFLFSSHETRASLYAALGRPSLAAIGAFTERYQAESKRNWSSVQLQHLGDKQEPVALSEIYVEPELELLDDIDPITTTRREARTLTVSDALERAPRSVFLGPAGIGKSTLVRFAATARIGAEGPDVVPIIVELRKFTADSLGSGLFADYIESEARRIVQTDAPDGWLQYLLLTGRAAVFFDGYDEVLDVGARAGIRDSIRAFAQLYPSASVVVTSRLTGYGVAPFSFAEFQHLRVRDFDDPRIAVYAEKWFGTRSLLVGGTVEQFVESFLGDSERYAASIRVNPLMLSLLCGLYYSRGEIPHSLSELYERCATLMFQEWNTMRGIDDTGAFAADLRSALYFVAWTILESYELMSDGISQAQLEQKLATHWIQEMAMAPETAYGQARKTVEVWSGRAWMMTAVSSDEYNRPQFGFVHQSFLEFFAATYVVRASDTPEDLLKALHSRLVRQNGWVVAQMAVSIFDRWKSKGGGRFIRALINARDHNSDSEYLQLLSFALSLRNLVSFQETLLSALTAALLRLYQANVLEPRGERDLDSLNERTRSIHAVNVDIEEEWDDDDYYDDYGRDDQLLPDVSVIEIEPAAREAVIAMLENVRTSDELLALFPDTPGIGVAAACLVTAIAQQTSTANFVSELRRSCADFSTHENTWLDIAGLWSLGVISDVDAAELLPWRVMLTNETLVPSYEFDITVPALVSTDTLQRALGGHKDSRRVLHHFGAGILAEWREQGLVSPLHVDATSGLVDLGVPSQSLSANAPVTHGLHSAEYMLGVVAVSVILVDWHGHDVIDHFPRENELRVLRQLIDHLRDFNGASIDVDSDARELDAATSGLISALVARKTCIVEAPF
ncbi:NACHT domain-containing protein [Herbiconiux sp.]|uniref:NACHT domain-containing protein n=1 Tax=Herbiconiux sp. TaxID=1871186 RepID=UPI0025C548A0|nr:NACHT domain-containing protein [Herbiconiux sp.]